MSPAVVLTFSALVGACIGSFLNVVIWRLPRGESVARGRSHCPACGHAIRWHDNVPVLGWLRLRGRCRDCRARISPRYPLVEALTAVLFVLVAAHRDPVTETGAAFAVAGVLSALVAVSFIDADRREIPDAITKPGIAAGLLASFLLAGLRPTAFLPELGNRHLAALLEAGLGALTGAAVLLAVRWLGLLAFRKEAMGLGDVKLLAMVGAFTRPLDVLLTLLVASVGGSVLGGVYVAVRARRLAPLAGGLAVGGRARVPFTRGRVRAPRRGPVLVGAWLDRSDARVAEKAALDVVLPGATVWSDDGKDVRLSLGGVVDRVEPHGSGVLVTARPEPLAEADEEWLSTFALNRVSIPFGVFLSLGAAAVLLYGDEVARFVLETWPRLVVRR